MSEQQPDQTSDESGSVGAGSTAPHSDPLIDTVMASMREPGGEPASLIAPDHEAPKPDLPRSDLPKADLPKAEAPKMEAAAASGEISTSSKPDATSGSEAKGSAPRAPGKLMIMSPGDPSWSEKSWSEKSWNEKPADKDVKAEPAPASRKRRFAAMAAVAVLALVAGAIGGALATTGFTHVADAKAAQSNDQALQASIARIDAEIATLKAGLDQTSKLGLVQFNKATDRLDKIEKAQVEPAARLAKLSEAVDKLRAAPAAAAPVAVAAATPTAKEPTARERVATGSVTAPAGAASLPMPAAAPKSEPNRMPIVGSWILRDVGHGGALVEGRQGLYEVYAGDPLPGLGRVDGIRKQDGRWVVVTTRGLIVSR